MPWPTSVTWVDRKDKLVRLWLPYEPIPCGIGGSVHSAICMRHNKLRIRFYAQWLCKCLFVLTCPLAMPSRTVQGSDCKWLHGFKNLNTTCIGIVEQTHGLEDVLVCTVWHNVYTTCLSSELHLVWWPQTAQQLPAKHSVIGPRKQPWSWQSCPVHQKAHQVTMQSHNSNAIAEL